MKSTLMRCGIALTVALIGSTACGNSNDPGDAGGNGTCNVTLSGAQTASLDCSAATVAWSAEDNVTLVGVLPDDHVPLVIISFGVPGQPATTSYHNGDAGVVIALAVSDGTNGWTAATEDGGGTTGSATVTITSLSTTVSNADGKVYAAHGTVTATLQPDPSTAATGTVTLNATF